ncbi:hypothetical protein [Filimonas effusa]|uniref:Uncharacterized protein n=1 Tax=Filimonas effusa TaxID=2508721 RepID=A0A4V1M9U5_9BACT|nr:hypothetical protein [Filimonas effusa]RXK82894.1 hypothetical protein ESB13_12250 [Filimonas effusa]
MKSKLKDLKIRRMLVYSGSDGKRKGTFELFSKSPLSVAKTGQLSNQIVRDFILFAEAMGCHDDIEKKQALNPENSTWEGLSVFFGKFTRTT